MDFIILHDKYGEEMFVNLRNISTIVPKKGGLTEITWVNGWEEVAETMEEIKMLIIASCGGEE